MHRATAVRAAMGWCASLATVLAPEVAFAGSDFNGDGLDDLAIGVPDEDTSGGVDAGAVNIRYGGNVIAPLSLKLGGTGHTDVRFGYALAYGDFDHDGYDDLVVGAPGDSSLDPQAGVVRVFRGSSNGLLSFPWRTYGSSGTLPGGLPREDAHFGAALAVGDFDGNNNLDIAIGAPDEAIEAYSGDFEITYPERGTVRVLTNVLGATTAGHFVHVLTNQENAHVGFSLAAGNFNGDDAGSPNNYELDDLAIGAPGTDVGSATSAGAVHVMWGNRTGNFNQASTYYRGSGLSGPLTANDLVGYSLAAGVYTNDGYDDLVIGAPFHSPSGYFNAGMVFVKRGGPSGWSSTQALNAISLGSAHASVLYLGWAVGMADFNGDGADELVIGAPGLSVSGVSGAGGVFVYPAGGPAQLWHRAVTGVPGSPGTNDRFGRQLACGDFDGAANDDIWIGAPYDDHSSTTDAGAITILYSGASGLGTSGALELAQGDLFAGETEPNDHFGGAGLL
jgi:hypothetical protein